MGFLRNRLQAIRQYRVKQQVAPYVHKDAVVMPNFKLFVHGGDLDGRLQVDAGTMLECRLHYDRAIGTVTIGRNCWIGQSDIICAQEIRIGSDAGISWGCTVSDHDSHPLDWRKRAHFIHSYREAYRQSNSRAAARVDKDWSEVGIAPIVIEDKVFIGHSCIIMKGVTIGEGSIIAAGSVVATSIPAWCVAAGYPARVIKRLEPDP